MTKGPYSDPSTVTPESGHVYVDGPDGIAIALTPEAALETGDRLIDGAREAMGQRAMEAAKRDETKPSAHSRSR